MRGGRREGRRKEGGRMEEGVEREQGGGESEEEAE